MRQQQTDQMQIQQGAGRPGESCRWAGRQRRRRGKHTQEATRAKDKDVAMGSGRSCAARLMAQPTPGEDRASGAVQGGTSSTSSKLQGGLDRAASVVGSGYDRAFACKEH